MRLVTRGQRACAPARIYPWSAKHPEITCALAPSALVSCKPLLDGSQWTSKMSLPVVLASLKIWIILS